jgi:hypothetical protein
VLTTRAPFSCSALHLLAVRLYTVISYPAFCNAKLGQSMLVYHSISVSADERTMRWEHMLVPMIPVPIQPTRWLPAEVAMVR